MKKISLLSVILILMSTLLLANGGKEVKTTDAGVKGALEAPELAKMVEAGTLPPLSERLPENPLVVKPLESEGKYGGVWHNIIVNGDLTHITRFQGYDRLLSWNPDWSGILPNLAESYEVSPDSREFTFHLRKGVRWSDGELLTADDFEFYYNDVIGNSELYPAFPRGFTSGEKQVRAVFTKIDQYNFKYTFSEPNGLFLLRSAEPGQYFLPKHYLSQFHTKYNKDAGKLAADAGFSSWVENFLAKGGSGANPDMYTNADFPVIDPWKFTTVPDGSNSISIATRNPYYWKVDTAGKQLPYIDKIEYAMIADNEVALLKALNGELDFQDQHIASPGNKSVLFDNQDKGNYRFITTTMAAPNAMAIQFNLNHPDPIKNKIFGDKNFRIGMSHAINRQEIIDIVFLGQGTPLQVAPVPESDLYTEKMGKQYTEFNVAKANEFLDKVMPKKDSEGYRLQPDGKRLIILFEIDAVRSTFIDGMELMIGYWKNVGVDVQMKTIARPLWDERVRNAGLVDATIHRFGGGVGSLIMTDPRYFFPFNGNSIYATGWATWYTNPAGLNAIKAPVEPPANIKKQMELYDKLLVSGDEPTQKKLMKEILAISADVFYHIGVCTEADSYAIVNKNLVNVPNTMPWNWIYPHPAPANPTTWYYK